MEQILKKILPDHVFSEAISAMRKYSINTPLQAAHFLSHCAHESGDFKRTEENLMYSENRLLVMFPGHFSEKNVRRYAYNPVNIASRVYANRIGNGNEASKEVPWKRLYSVDRKMEL